MPRLSTCPLILILIAIAVAQLVLPARMFHLSEKVTEHAYTGIIRRLDEFADRAAPPSSQNAPLSFGACCGIGHRFERIIKTVTFAKLHHRTVFAHWPDVSWSFLFYDTALVKMAPAGTEREKEHYANGQPKEWWRSPSDIVRNASQRLKVTLDDETSTVYDRYVHQLLEMETAHKVVEQFRQSLSDEVLAYLEPLRGQYATKSSANGLHICVHIRTGNNETGAWRIASQRRDIDVIQVLNGTLNAMLYYANESGASRDRTRDISVFVASDNDSVRPWFQQRLPQHWRIISSGRSMTKPSSGVLFGEHGSKTSAALTQDQRNKAMAEGVADMFALGECSALFLPTYSSFTILSILLAKRQNHSIFYGEKHYYYKRKGLKSMGFLSDQCLFNKRTEWPWPKCWAGACGLIAKKSCRIDSTGS